MLVRSTTSSTSRDRFWTVPFVFVLFAADPDAPDAPDAVLVEQRAVEF